MKTTLREQADDYLQSIAICKKRVADAESAFEREVAAIREKYQEEIDVYAMDLGRQAINLVALMKENTVELFDGREKVKLIHGILLHTKEPKFSLPRNVLERIEEQGWDEAIKIAKSVDRAVVEKWPEERLFLIGGKRKTKEKFEYEVKAETP